MIGVIQTEAFAEGVLVRPIGFGELFSLTMATRRESSSSSAVKCGRGGRHVHGVEITLVDDVAEHGIGGLSFGQLVAEGDSQGHFAGACSGAAEEQAIKRTPPTSMVAVVDTLAMRDLFRSGGIGWVGSVH
jgi:hypothetical protein